MKPKTKFKSKKYINNTKKIKGGGPLLDIASSSNEKDVASKGGQELTKMMGGSFSEMTFTKFLSLSIQALLKIVGSISTLPIRNVDELIPPELCKKFANPFACSQSVLQYLFTGTKPDNKKVLPDSDKNDCISYDEDGNKIVHCKQIGGTRKRKNKSKHNYQYGGEGMIIGCENEIKMKNSKKNQENQANQDKQIKEKKEKKEKMLKHLNQHLKLLLHKLKKLNIYLRKYLCPKKKIEALIKKINDIKLLKKTLEVCKTLLNNSHYDDNKSDNERLRICDEEYNKLNIGQLRVQADTKHLGLLIFPRDRANCEDCSQASLWAETLGKYYSLFKGAINGNTNNIHYIMMNIIQDMAKLDKSDDPILGEIRNILKNIECRSNLTQVIEDRIKELK